MQIQVALAEPDVGRAARVPRHRDAGAQALHARQRVRHDDAALRAGPLGPDASVLQARGRTDGKHIRRKASKNGQRQASPF